MIDEVPPVVPPLAAVAEPAAPSPEATPPGQSAPPPTDAQMQTADRVFTARTPPHPMATLLGVCTSALLLRDVAVDTFDTSEEEEDTETDEKPDSPS